MQRAGKMIEGIVYLFALLNHMRERERESSLSQGSKWYPITRFDFQAKNQIHI